MELETYVGHTPENIKYLLDINFNANFVKNLHVPDKEYPWKKRHWLFYTSPVGELNLSKGIKAYNSKFLKENESSMADKINALKDYLQKKFNEADFAIHKLRVNQASIGQGRLVELKKTNPGSSSVMEHPLIQFQEKGFVGNDRFSRTALLVTA